MGRIVVDTSVLVKGFGLKNDSKLLHKAGDYFNSRDEAALAFALMYLPKTSNSGNEWGANLYDESTRTKTRFTFRNVTEGNGSSVNIPSPDWLKTHVGMTHTHPNIGNNSNFFMGKYH